MSPFVIYILLCAASTARPDCDTHNAIDVVLGPEVNNELNCGLQAQEMFAKTTIRPRGRGRRKNLLRSASPTPNRRGEQEQFSRPRIMGKLPSSQRS
jgi:hypothetical protein